VASHGDFLSFLRATAHPPGRRPCVDETLEERHTLRPYGRSSGSKDPERCGWHICSGVAADNERVVCKALGPGAAEPALGEARPAETLPAATGSRPFLRRVG